MSAKSILEADGKAILNYHLTRAPVIKPTPLPPPTTHNPPPKLASLHFPEDTAVSTILDQAESKYPWLLAPGAKFVAKPDQLIKRRGKSGLLALNKTWLEARNWIEERAGKPVKVETVTGVLRQFLVEPFVPHPSGTEYYININSVREVWPTFVALPLLTRPPFFYFWSISVSSVASPVKPKDYPNKALVDLSLVLVLRFGMAATVFIWAQPRPGISLRANGYNPNHSYYILTIICRQLYTYIFPSTARYHFHSPCIIHQLFNTIRMGRPIDGVG
jgi:hypothetical protein